MSIFEIMVAEVVEKPKVQEKSSICSNIAKGQSADVPKRKKNAFLHPKDPEAVIPKHKLAKPLDLRLPVPS